jgi:hypothetical protein
MIYDSFQDHLLVVKPIYNLYDLLSWYNFLYPCRDSIAVIAASCTSSLDGPAVSALRCAIAEVKQRWSVIGWVPKYYYLNLLRASEGTLSRWSRFYLHSLALGLWAVIRMCNP